MNMSIFEACMIICFGISWPVAIMKTLKTRSVQGKSRMFLILVLSGYGLGILHKVFYSLDYVLALYLFNFTMVFIELCLCIRYNNKPFPVIATASGEEDYCAADTLLAEPEQS